MVCWIEWKKFSLKKNVTHKEQYSLLEKKNEEKEGSWIEEISGWH